jgi:hypothetical protein
MDLMIKEINQVIDEEARGNGSVITALEHIQECFCYLPPEAMGADAVGFGSAAEVALGCRVCYACQKGNCPYGITSQKPELSAHLDPFEGARRLANFIHACGEEVKILTMLSGPRKTAELSTEDLRAMDFNTASLTGLKLAGYDKPPPIWEASFGGGNGRH